MDHSRIMQAICAYYEAKVYPTTLPDELQRLFDTLQRAQVSTVLCRAAFGIHMVKHVLDKWPKGSTTQDRAKHHLMTHAMSIERIILEKTQSAIRQSLVAFDTHVKPLQRRGFGLVYFSHTSNDITCVENHFSTLMSTVSLLDAQSLVDDMVNSIKPVVQLAFEEPCIVDTSKAIEQYAPDAFNGTKRYHASCLFTSASSHTPLVAVHAFCEWLSRDVLQMEDHSNRLPTLSKMLPSCEDAVYWTQDKAVYDRAASTTKHMFAKHFAVMLMTQLKAFLTSFKSIKALLHTMQLDSVGELENALIEWQDGLLVLGLMDIEQGDFLSDLDGFLSTAYRHKQTLDILARLDPLLRSPPVPYTLTLDDRAHLKTGEPMRQILHHAYQVVDGGPMPMEWLSLPDIMVSGQCKAIFSACHQLKKDKHIQVMQSILTYWYHVSHEDTHIVTIRDHLIAYNDLCIYAIHQLMCLERDMDDNTLSGMKTAFETRGQYFLNAALSKVPLHSDPRMATVEIHGFLRAHKTILSKTSQIKALKRLTSRLPKTAMERVMRDVKVFIEA